MCHLGLDTKSGTNSKCEGKNRGIGTHSDSSCIIQKLIPREPLFIPNRELVNVSLFKVLDFHMI